MKTLKLIIWIIFGLVLGLTKAIAGKDDGATKATNSPLEIMVLNRHINQVDDDIVNLKPVVPSRIFHGGTKEVLLQNAGKTTFTEKEWSIFMKSNKYPPFRRGLYGTASLKTNSYASHWVAEVQIQDSCRDPQKVVSLHALQKDKRFHEWFHSKAPKEFPSLERFFDSCYITAAQAGIQGAVSEIAKTWEVAFPMTNGNGLTETFPSIPATVKAAKDDCANVFQQFLTDFDFKIVFDELHSPDPGEAFYIRDRLCIKKISTSPEEILSLFADSPHLWIKDVDNEIIRSMEGKRSCIFGLTTIIPNALDSLNTSLPRELLEKLLKNSELLPDSMDFHKDVVEAKKVLREKIEKAIALAPPSIPKEERAAN